ncbi:three component ABC system middle component [uncultured Candidatus Kuenenia sp.]|uniref:three component ABC system middle component n=1 Tax=uncultured Candidatus Kuenenia sp. TaxID=1048336 RepID=UPI0025FBD162|nr:three component ABC system middle component [uncultured Candidatus Kuenenia sp.]
MSKFADSIYQIHNNPFVLAPLFVEFFRYIRPKPQNILLAYLVLPLVLHEDSKQWLVGAKITSSIHTFCNKKKNIFGLQERVRLYKYLTNQCLQYAMDNQMIKINENLIVEVLIPENKTVENLRESLKAASNLYKVFRELDVVAIYRLLGVKEL